MSGVVNEQVDNILTYLQAFTRPVMKEALKQWNRKHMERVKEKKAHDATEWKPWPDKDPPPKPFEWMESNGQKFYREPPPRVVAEYQQAQERREEQERESAACPFCGDRAFPQAVCPKCAKGKAGLKIHWICGNNSDHVFFTE